MGSHQSCFDPLDSLLMVGATAKSKFTLTANALTLSRIVFAPFVAALVLQMNPRWLTFVLTWILGITDRIDGDLARKIGPTKAGAFLDTLADKILLLFLGYALVIQGAFGIIPMSIIAVREVGMMIYRSYWQRYGLSLPARPSGKYKAVVQGLAIVAAMFPPLRGSHWVIDVMLWVAVAFTLVSAAQYIIDGQKALKDKL